MKKTRVLALVLAVAVMLMGAGYAAWTDSITATTTVQTGTLDVQFMPFTSSQDATQSVTIDDLSTSSVDEMDEKVTVNYGENNNNWGIKINESNITSDGKGLEFGVEGLLPGTGYNTEFKLKNKGSVPARIKKVNVEVLDRMDNSMPNTESPDRHLYEKLNMAVKFYHLDKDTSTPVFDSDALKDTKPQDWRLTLSNLEEELDKALIGRVLYPNDELISGEADQWTHIGMYHYDFNGTDGQNSKLTIKLSFDFQQANVDELN